MTYDALETSRETNRPAEVYRIIQGSLTFEYTSAEDELEVESVTYLPEAISRGRIGQSPTDRRSVLEVRVPATNSFASRFKPSTPAGRAQIVIRRVQRDDFPGPEAVIIFDGFVSSVSFEEDAKVAVLACTPSVAAQSRPIPRFSFQGMCNHVLFDDNCKVDDADARWRLASSVSAASGSVITVPGITSFGADWFVGGLVILNDGDDARLVLSQSGNDLQLLLPFPGSAVGSSVVVLAGCDHLIATCDAKFNTPEDPDSNVINYGGFAYVPTKNPFQTGIL